jgi:group I intron endonuclease
MKTGVYTITNTVNNKIYVGSTTMKAGFPGRFQRHISYLRYKTHKNTILQNAWNKYGEENFKFEVLEECLSEFCLSTEQYWINVLNVCNRKYGYNIRYLAKSNLGLKHSEETKKKLSDVHKGKCKSAIHRKNLSLSKIGKKNNFIFKHSKETKLKLSKMKSKPVIKLDKNNNILETYNSTKEAAKLNNLKSGSDIAKMCNYKSKNKFVSGFKWKWKNDENSNN